MAIKEKENRQKLNNGYWLCHDALNWWISKEEKSEKSGLTTLRRVSGYCPDVASAFESLSVRHMNKIESTSITNLIKEVKALKSLVIKLADDIKEAK